MVDLVSGRTERKIIIDREWAFALSVNRDLVAEASALDRIVQAAGFVLSSSDGALDTNLIPVPKARSNVGFTPATCIVHTLCGASPKDAAVRLFDSARPAHPHSLPQHQQQRYTRTRSMVYQVNPEAVGGYTHSLDYEAVSHTGMSVGFASDMNVDSYRAMLKKA